MQQQGRKMTKTREQISLDNLQAQVQQLQTRVAELEQSSRVANGRFRTLRQKLSPNLWTFIQYPPRPLVAAPRLATSNASAVSDDLPSISVVTPSFNQGQFIPSTIESVLSQNYPNLSYRVQDGGSTDETVAVLRQHERSLEWSSEPDRGQTHAINLGLAGRPADIMAYLNSDDVLLPGALHYVSDFFRKNPHVDVVYSHRIFIDRFGMEVGRAILPHHDPVAIKWADYVPQETMFWRRKVWDSVGPFDEDFRYAMDWDFILRAQAKGFTFRRLPTFLAAFRVHDLQKTTSLRTVGEKEQMRLRTDNLGFLPTYKRINEAIRPYLRRQVIYTRLYKLKLLTY